jgi:hypothetical protein
MAAERVGWVGGPVPSCWQLTFGVDAKDEKKHNRLHLRNEQWRKGLVWSAIDLAARATRREIFQETGRTYTAVVRAYTDLDP